MQPTSPPVRDVLLVGGGHSHIQVIKRNAMRPVPGVRLTLIADAYQSPYSGMLPGCIAGDYQAGDIHFNLERLCQFAGARFVHAEAVGLDLDAQSIVLRDRPELRYDVLSINCGAQPAAPYPGAVTVKPISRFLPAWQALKKDLSVGGDIAIIGAGAGGVELAFAVRAVAPEIGIFLVGSELLPGHGAKARVLADEALREHRIEWLRQRVQGASVELGSGRTIGPERMLWVTDVHAAAWLGQAGLETDELGFVSVNRHLQSVSHPNVFAAGDVAHLVGQERPKSGVYAVRAGPVLAENLYRAAQSRRLVGYRAQRSHLALLGCGDGTAIASRGSWAARGTSWWRLKQFIDRRFMRKFNELKFMEDEGFELPSALAGELPDDSMRCGGCGAKLAADPLRRVLARLPRQSSDSVVLGIGDDAALVKNNGVGTLLTVDGFRAMVSDPYAFGRIAAHHSLNDIFAMGADPVAALALVTVPLMSEPLMEEDLYQMLRGVTDVLGAHGVALAGGHSAESAELSVGLTVTGVAREDALTKAGARPGDRLVLTKPIGTGVILAAAMRGRTTVESVAGAIASMDQSNAAGAAILQSHDAHALTDVTGFGLAGHLGEMLRASVSGAVVRYDAVPHLAGALDLLTETTSSLQSANELALHDFTVRGAPLSDPRLRILADPQTSGGLLAALPEAQVDACLDALHGAGYDAAAIIGEVASPDCWMLE